MKFGIYGYRHAHIQEFIQQMLELGHEPVGVYEPDASSVKPLSEKYNIPIMETAERLFARGPEIIGSSAVNNRKIDILEACADRGIHAMFDKPLVTTMGGFERLQRVVNEGRIQVGLMLTERFNPPIYALKKLIDEGKLGSLASLSFLKPHKLRADKRPAWHFSKEENGGILIDLLIHDFDLIMWLTGSEIELSSGFLKKTGYPQYPDFYDSVHVMVKMKNNVVATLESDWYMPDAYWTWGDGRIFCTGTKGRAEIRTVGDKFTKQKPFGLITYSDKDIEILPEEHSAINLTEDFLRRIKGEKDVILPHKDIIKASYAAVRADEQVKILK